MQAQLSNPLRVLSKTQPEAEVMGDWLLAIGYGLLAIGYGLLVMGWSMRRAAICAFRLIAFNL